MTDTVIELGNHKVYTDKEIAEVKDLVVKFVDGSSVNVLTGQVINMGPGYINLNNDPEIAKSKIVTVGPKTFVAKAVGLENLSMAEVEVKPYNGTSISVTLTGPEDMVEAVKFTKGADGELIISGEDVKPKSSVSSESIRISNVNATRSSVSISIGESHRLQVQVEVPVGTSLRLTGDFKKVDVGDLHGPLRLSYSGMNDLYIGKMKSAYITGSGMGKIRIEELAEGVVADIGGQGSLVVKNIPSGPSIVSSRDMIQIQIDKIVGDLQATTRGASQIKILSHQGDLAGKLHGAGGLKIANITGSVEASVNDQTHLKLENGSIPVLEVTATGMASVKVEATATNAVLTARGMSGIRVETVTNRPITKNDWMATVKVKNWR